jgi:hypothetical protein
VKDRTGRTLSRAEQAEIERMNRENTKAAERAAQRKGK